MKYSHIFLLVNEDSLRNNPTAHSQIVSWNLNRLQLVFLLCRAKADAEGILNEYREEAQTYKSLMTSNDLNTQGFLAYMGIRAIEDQDNTVFVGMDAPAKTDWAV